MCPLSQRPQLTEPRLFPVLPRTTSSPASFTRKRVRRSAFVSWRTSPASQKRASPVLIIPAIDIKNGRCVRLYQGEMDKDTIYYESPVEAAKHWVEQGAELLHVVDLNGAIEGHPVHKQEVAAICMGFGVPVELGGASRIIYTDISRDGTGLGVNVEETLRLARAVRIPVIASGGVASLEDIRRLKVLEKDGVEGVIVGRALYSGAFTLKEAIAVGAAD